MDVRTFVKALLAHLFSRSEVVVGMVGALASSQEFGAALLSVIDALLTNLFSRNRFTVGMAETLAGGYKCDTALLAVSLSVVQTLLARCSSISGIPIRMHRAFPLF